MNALLGGKQGGSGSGHNSNSSPFGGLANQVISGLTHSNTGGHGQQQQHHGSSSASGGLGGKIVGQLTSNLFSSGNKPAQPQNYHSGQASQSSHNSGGLAGSMMGGVAHMFGGQSGASVRLHARDPGMYNADENVYTLTDAHSSAEPKLWILECRPDRNLQWLRASHHVPTAGRILAAPVPCARAQRAAHPQRPSREHSLLLPCPPAYAELSSAAEPVRGATRVPGPAATTYAVWPARANTRAARRRTACAIWPVPVRAGLRPAAGATGVRRPPARRVQRGDAIVPSASKSIPVPVRLPRPGSWPATRGTSLRKQSRVLGRRGILF